MFYFILSTIFSLISAQSIYVIDAQTNEPIKDVNVYFEKNGTTTDSNGFFILNTFNEGDQITLSRIGYETITLPFNELSDVIQLKKELIPMELVSVYGKNKNLKKRYTRLEKNVRKVYPYAKEISDLLVKYSSVIDTLEQYSGLIRYQKKRKIFSKIEDQLISKHGYSIKKLTKSQGRILIRLVDRETSKTSFEIIKDFRHVLIAGFWQFTARMFGHNLLSIYNPIEGEDRMIEHIINKIKNEKS